MTSSYFKIYGKKLGEKTISALTKRHFEAYYTESKEEALKKAIELIPQSDTVAWGGSMSIIEAGLIDYVLNNNYKVINRDTAKTPDEKLDLLRKSLLCDTYLMGTNAISQDGELVNIDCNGNRTAALMFGPKQVIIISSIKKIMPTVEDAIKRARNYAAPINIQRIAGNSEKKTPCFNNGSCYNCLSEDSICSHIVITRLCTPQNRIKIILTADDIGF